MYICLFSDFFFFIFLVHYQQTCTRTLYEHLIVNVSARVSIDFVLDKRRWYNTRRVAILLGLSRTIIKSFYRFGGGKKKLYLPHVSFIHYFDDTGFHKYLQPAVFNNMHTAS